MNTLIVSLIGAQTVPNLEFLNWCTDYIPNEKFDLLFLSSQQMEKFGKTDLIISVLSDNIYPFENWFKLIVDQEDFSDIEEKYQNFFKTNPYEKIIVNITGGTKLASLKSYLFFQKSNIEIFYKPINGKMQKLFPFLETIENTKSICLEDALKLNGFSFTKDNNCTKDLEFYKAFYKFYSTHESGVKFINQINDSVKNLDGTFDCTEMPDSKLNYYSIENKKNALELIQFCNYDPKHFSKDGISLIKGGWFEQYSYLLVKKIFNLADEQIYLNVKLTSQNDVDNEFDVIYMDINGILHVIECKSLWANGNPDNVVLNALYKLKAATSRFGLKTKGHIMTNLKTKSEKLLARAKDFQIEILDDVL